MPSPRALLSQALRETRTGLWRTAVNSVAGSHLVPGSVRAVLLRRCGVDCRSAWLSGGVTITHPNLHIGRAAYLNEGVLLESAGGISIGAGALIGPRATILTSTHDVGEIVDPRSRTEPVVVGAGAWIGAQVTVLPGVTIGPGVVVGAGAVVTRDLLVPGLYVGVPARLVKARSGPSSMVDATGLVTDEAIRRDLLAAEPPH